MEGRTMTLDEMNLRIADPETKLVARSGLILSLPDGEATIASVPAKFRTDALANWIAAEIAAWKPESVGGNPSRFRTVCHERAASSRRAYPLLHIGPRSRYGVRP